MGAVWAISANSFNMQTMLAFNLDHAITITITISKAQENKDIIPDYHLVYDMAINL